MYQLTNWLNASDNFTIETFNRLSTLTTPKIRTRIATDDNGLEFEEISVHVPESYIEKCREYVQKNCRIKV